MEIKCVLLIHSKRFEWCRLEAWYNKNIYSCPSSLNCVYFFLSLLKIEIFTLKYLSWYA